ncbi:MAG: hypothetical protein SFX73_20125 [Kofleriaceae bacterium]|nr:hypothetical protein [Kofleriaceae bacterium]
MVVVVVVDLDGDGDVEVDALAQHGDHALEELASTLVALLGDELAQP